MKIIVDLSALNFKYIGGIGYYIKNLLESFDDQEKQLIVPLYPVKPKFDHDLKGYKKETLGLNGRIGTIEWYYLGGLFLRKYNPDVFWGPAYIIPRMLNKNVKAIVTIHDNIIFLKNKKHENLIAKIWHGIYHSSARYSERVADKVITVSQSSANDLANIFPDISKKIEVVSPSINKVLFKNIPDAHERFSEKYKINDPFALIIHMESERKNFRLIVDAFKKQDKGILCAAGRLYDEKISYAKSQLENRFKYLGYVDTNDLPMIYSAANVFIGASEAEGFDLPPLEARACGTKVIASDIPIHREVLETEAEYFKIGDVDKLSKLIFDTLSSDKIYVPSKVIDKYDWKKSANKMLKIFSE